MAILPCLFIGFILWIFDLDNILVKGFNEVFHTYYTTSVYWLAFFVVGVFISILQAFKW